MHFNEERADLNTDSRSTCSSATRPLIAFGRMLRASSDFRPPFLVTAYGPSNPSELGFGRPLFVTPFSGTASGQFLRTAASRLLLSRFHP